MLFVHPSAATHRADTERSVPTGTESDAAHRATAKQRSGKVLVVTALMLTALFGFTALAVDATYLMEVKKETQISAESAALAGTLGLLHPDMLKPNPDATNAISDARSQAVLYAGKNLVVNSSPLVDRNEGNAFDGDIVVGRLPSWSYQNYPWEFDDPLKYNSVRVHVKRTADRNGPVALFFANIFGIQSSPVESVATAIVQRGAIGFNPGGGDGNTSLMPFAIRAEDWINLIDNGGSQDDNWAYSAESGVTAGPDGIFEITMYPQSFPAGGESSGGITPGNFGTVDIGNTNNATPDIIRQILDGVSAEDLAYHNGGEDLVLYDEGSSFDLNGETGLSAGIKSALESIVGECRTVMLFTEVEGPGNNAMFTIVRYVSIKIMKVQLTGNPKYITVQPSFCLDGSAIIDPSGEVQNFVVLPPRLIE
ncbi:MAG: pilus assembly protein TadG-related protein [Planctomycetaceae bacterium]